MVSGAAGNNERKQRKRGAYQGSPFFCWDLGCSENDWPPNEQLPRIRFEWRGLCAFHEVLGVATVWWRLIVRQLAGGAVDVAVNHTDRRRPRIHRAAEKVRARRIIARDHLPPDRSGK